MKRSILVFLTALSWVCQPALCVPPEPPPSIVWHADRQRVDANLRDLPVEKALGKFSGATGWRVYLETRTGQDVSAKFQDATVGEALRLMLGSDSFAVVPQTNGPTKVFVYRTSPSSATNLVAAEKRKSSVIGNELIIRLKPGSTNAGRLAGAVHGKVLGGLDALRAYRLQFADDAAAQAARQALQNSPDVASVSSNYTMEQPSPVDSLQGAQANPFQLKAQTPGDTGKIVVGLVDMPVQNVSPSMQQFLLPAVSAAGQTPDVNAESTPTHGTSMAEIILNQLAASSGNGGSSTVRILPVDVYGANQSTTSFDVAAGITAAVNGGANVINLSLGGDGDSDLLHSVIQQAKSQGVEFFAAAGNTPVTTDTYPAAYPGVVAVTAVQPDGAPASYANRGTFVAVGAPGDGLVSYEDSSWVVSGTSTATAKATGAFAAAAAANPSMSFGQLQAQFEARFAFKPPTTP